MADDARARRFRSPEAVRTLEELQRGEYALGGEEVPDADHRESLRRALQMQALSDAFDRGGFDAMIDAAGEEQDWDAEMDGMIARWRVPNPDQWSRHERPDYVARLADLAGRLDDAASAGGHELPLPPVLGTLPTRQVAAVAQSASDGAIVLIDSGFFRFSETLAQLAAQALFEATYGSTGSSAHSEETVKLLCDLVATHTALGTCLHLFPRSIHPTIAPVVEGLDDGIGLFVVGHEYAHVVAGDLDVHPLGSPGLTTAQLELGADRLGLELAMAAQRPCPPCSNYAVAASLLYLAGLDLLEQAETCDGTAPAERAGHPTPGARADALAAALTCAPLGPDVRGELALGFKAGQLLLDIWESIRRPFAEVLPELRLYAADAFGLPEHIAAAVVFSAWDAVSRGA